MTIVAVGRARDGPEATLVVEYLRRLGPSARVIEVREAADRPDRQRREGEALLAAVPSESRLIALDRRGKTLSSEDLAGRLRRWRDQGAASLCFVIGGADGLDDSVLERAEFVLSLGAMTWPHLLARTMLAEQLYRAASLMAGHPYHR
jgi:23S rRNA (pseudouridine1915-N3)-methyltransferase